MANFEFCINKSVEAGRITREVADRILDADNADDAVSEIVLELSQFKREAAIQSVILAKGWKNIKSHPDGVYAGLVSLMARDIKGKANYANVDYQANVWKARLHAKFADALNAFKTTRLGFAQDKEGLHKMIRAIYGESVDDPEIMAFAGQWSELTDFIRTEFNRLGGSINNNEKWLLPQSHNAQAIEKIGKETWKEEITDLLDRQQMKDDLGQPLTDEAFEEALDYVYETITTGGINKTKDFTVPKLGKKLSRKHSEKRFLYFKDADSWMFYQDKYGRGDIFSNLTDYINSSGDDLGLMEIMGPSPENTFKILQNQAQKDKKFTDKQRAFSQSIFNVVSGKINQGELTGVADFMQSIRNLITASTLGSAFISAISDTALNAITSKYNNVPAYQVLSRQLSLLNPAKKEDRLFAVKLGLMADNWTQRANASNRYSDVYGTGVTAKVAEGVMRGSLLAPWTDAGRKAFGMEFSSMLADMFNKSFDELPSNLNRAFETYGIDADDWNMFRRQEPLDFEGAKFANMLSEGGEKFHRMVLTETDFAVPTPDANVRAITTAGSERNTVLGQMIRSGMALKSFPITMATGHFYRAAYQATTADKLFYAGALVTTTTILGAAAIQAKDIAKGREPREVDNLKFWGAAFMQGGGAGIFGDFLFSDVNRFGGGLSKTVLGPTGEMADKTISLTLGNLQEAIRGEETNVIPEAIQYLKRYQPKIWQIQMLTDSMWDNAELMSDPNAQKRFNNIIRKRQKEYNQGYWWGPGKAIPEFLQ